jgi:hypothetical protein
VERGNGTVVPDKGLSAVQSVLATNYLCAYDNTRHIHASIRATARKGERLQCDIRGC